MGSSRSHFSAMMPSELLYRERSEHRDLDAPSRQAGGIVLTSLRCPDVSALGLAPFTAVVGKVSNASIGDVTRSSVD